MGRPLNKRFLGAPTAAGNEIKVQFHDGSNSLPGFVVKQLGSKRFRCSNAGGTSVADCILVDKASGTLAAGEMTITATGDVAPQTFAITVVNDGGGNVFVVDGVNKPILDLVRRGVYTFDQSDASNTNHQLAFKDADGNSYTDGIVTTGTPGQAGANTVFTVPANAPSSLRYYCVAHGNYMGNTITVTGSVVRQVIKISGRKVTQNNNTMRPWNFTGTGATVEIEEAGTAIGAGADTILGTADDVLIGATDIEGDD